MRMCCAAAAACVLLCAASVRADDATDHGAKVSRHWRPSTAVSSPHVPWMNPSAAGAVRVLVVQPWQNLREVVELSQRLEINFDVIPVTSVGPNCDETPGMFAYEQEDFAARLPHADVLILCGIPPQWFTDDLWRKMLLRIEQGMGVVWTVAIPQHTRVDELLATKTGTPDYLRRGAPFALLQRVDPNSAFHCATRGRGRVAAWIAPTMFRTGWTTMTPVTPMAGEEAYYAIVTRLVTWAAGRDPSSRILLPQPSTTLQAGLPHRIDATIKTEQPLASASLVCTVRDASPLWGFYKSTSPAGTLEWPRQIGRGELPVVHTFTMAVKLAAGEHRVELELPPLPDGAFAVDARLMDDNRRALDWDAATLFVEGSPRIRWLTLPETGIAPDGIAQAVVEIDQREGAPDGIQFAWHATDVHGRSLSQGSTPWNGLAAQTFEFSLHHALAKGVDVHVAMIHDGAAISRRTATGLVIHRRDKPFRYGVYEPLLSRMSDLSVDMLVTGYKGWMEERDLAEFDLDAYHWLNGPLLYNEKNATPVRSPCFNDPAFRATYEQYLASIAPMLKRQMAVGGLITDEWAYGWDHNAGRPGALHDLCQCDACVPLLRRFVREQFDGNLDALNAAWGASFKNWDDLTMPRLADVPSRLTPAATASRLRFADFTAAEFFRFAGEEARRHEPHARLGLSGTRPTDGINGYDYWQLAQRGARSFVHYGGPVVAQTLDLREAGVFVSKWEGYSIWNSSGADAVMWRAFIEEQDGLIQYAAYPSYGTHHTDWTLGAGTAAFGRAFREIDSGLAHLVRAAARLRSPIAIHYSPASFAVAAAGLAPGLNGTLMARRTDQVHRLLVDAGFDPLFRATEQVERGELLDRNIKVLVLPDSIAMSDVELQRLDAFQRDGGVVLATSPAARFTQHGSPRAAPPQFPALGNVDYAHGEQGGFGGELEKLAGNPEQEKIARARIAAQLKQWDVKPTIAVQKLNALACRIVTHRDGEATYHLIWPGPFLTDDRDQRPREEVAIDLPAGGHLYDLRRRAHLDEPRPLVRTIEEGDPVLLAVLPYRVDGLRLDAPSSDVQAGEMMKLSTRILTNGSTQAVDHVIEVNVVGPDDKPRPAYHQVCRAPRGVGEILIPLAPNDSPGVWRILGQDVTSGVRAEHRITITAK